MNLGEYQVVSEVGRGGMGVVLRARARDGSEVAIKLLRDPSRAGAAERFRREERLLGSLGIDEGFVPLLDSGVAAQGAFLVMPFVPGGTLRDRLRGRVLPVAEAVSIVRALALAVGRAHAKGIVHRDLKPENVLFTEAGSAGRPLVADLGLAKHFLDSSPGASQSVSLTREGTMKGTAGYMAPEQMRDAKTAGPPADVFALGAILYECVTGQPPFVADTPLALLACVDSGEFRPARELCAHVPRWLEAAIEKSLARDPLARPADAAAFAALLGPEERAARARSGALVPAALLAASSVTALLGLEARHRRAPLDVAAPSSAARTDDAAAVGSDRPEANLRPGFDGHGRSKKGRFRLAAVWGSTRWKHAFAPRTIAFSPEGRRILSGAGEWEAHLVDERGEDVALLTMRGAITASAFSPDGTRILLGAADGVVAVFPTNGKAHRHGRNVAKHQGAVVAVAFSSDGKRAYSVSADGAVSAVDVSRRGAVAVEKGSTETVSVAFAPDAESLVLVGADHRVRVRASEGTTPEALVGVDEPVSAVAYAALARRLLLAAGPQAIVFDLVTQSVVRRYAGLPANVSALAWARDGSRFAAAGDELVLVDAASGASRILGGQVGPATCVAFSPDSKRLVSGSSDRTLRLRDAATGAPLLWDDDDSARVVVGASADGSVFATGSTDRVVRIFSRGRARSLRAMREHASGIDALAVSPDGRVVVSGDEVGGLVFTDAATATPLLRLSEARGKIDGVAISADGALAAWGTQGAVVFWDLHAMKPLREVSVGPGATTVAFSRDGSRALASGGALAALIDPRTGATLAKVPLENGVAIAALAPDASLALVALGAGNVLSWTPALAASRASPPTGLGLTALAFSPDGARAFQLGYDRLVRIRERASDEEDEISFRTTADTPVSCAPVADGSFYVGTHRGLVCRYVEER